VNDAATLPLHKKPWVQTTLLVIGTIIIAYGMVYFEIIRRAHAAYDRGEALYAKGQFRQALWEYQECQEFYQPPHNKWNDLSEAKEWECRARLNDWAPPEGPLDEDIRVTRSQIYNKYQSALAVITPQPDTTYNPIPNTPPQPKKGAKKPAKSATK